MAELSTIARPYAEALFGVARADSAGLAAWAELVAEMAQAAAHPEVRSAIADPKLDNAQRVELFTATLKTQLSPAARNFVALLVENGRLLRRLFGQLPRWLVSVSIPAQTRQSF
ncbi:MAG: hypothetical protein ABT00_15580 [Bordetella sp. SCN 68-11]|nr:MAG: hypothetical protein ABT00_15580 [Bordetella sp. SCN 68-11]